MKLTELFESKVEKPKFKAIIDLSYSYDIPNVKDGTKAAIDALHKKAKAKFAELKKAHPTKFEFETLTAANAYVKTMEYPGWPIYAHTTVGKGDFRKARAEPADFSDWVEPPAETADDIQVTDMGDGRIKVSVKATKGPLINLIRSVGYNASKAKKKLQNSLDRTVNLSNFSSNRLIITASKAEVESYLAKAKKDNKEWDDDRAARAADKNDPEKKKAASKFNYEVQKARKQDLYDKFGKDIVERVKIKSLTHIDGDDGYQWSLWVDGKREKSGMTYTEAQSSQQSMWSYLLKLSKMTPEQLKKEADIAAGWKAYFMGQRMEVELNSYLHQMNKSAKQFVDSGNKTKSTIGKASGKVDPAKEMEDLIAKLRKKI